MARVACVFAHPDDDTYGWPDLLGTETFVVARPERSPGDAVDTDLLAVPPAS